jgi:hypothetical protein
MITDEFLHGRQKTSAIMEISSGGGAMREFSQRGQEERPHVLRRRPWRAALAATAGAIALIAGAASASAAPRAAGPHLGRAVRVQLPENAGKGTPIIESASCPSASSCTLAGSYNDSSHVGQAMVVTRSGGHWARATELRLPGNAEPSLGGLAESVSCSRAGSCVAAGNYRANGNFAGFTATESRGVWHRATQVTPPANAGTSVSISGVACTGPGNCVLAGNYSDTKGRVRPMVAIQTNGTWARAQELSIPAGADTAGPVLLTSLACPAAGSCVAVGQFNDKAANRRAMAVVQTHGTWHQPFQLVLPKDAASVPLASTTAVGCSSAGNCVAVGSYRTASLHFVPLSVTESGGTWARGQHITSAPANAATGAQGDVLFSSVACARGGPCTAAGSYLLKAGGFAALIVTRSGSSWTAPTQISVPAKAATGSKQRADAKAIGCAPSGFCAIGGTYTTASSTTAAMAASG